MRREFAPDSISEIIIEDINSSVFIKPGNRLAVTCRDIKRGFYDIAAEAGVLHVKYCFNKKSIFADMFRRKCIVLEIPACWHGILRASTTNARIIMEAGTDDVYLSTTNSRIVVTDTAAGALKAETSNGRICIDRFSSRSTELRTSNAGIKLNDVNAAENIIISTSNGSISAENISAPVFDAATGNGAIRVKAVDSGNISLVTYNASVTGVLPGSMADYMITSSTSNGKNSLPSASNGKKKLNVETSNAKIDILFEN